MAGGRSVPLGPDGRFALKIPLRSGPNEILLEARDQVGNEDRWRQTVLLDQEPPRLLSHRLIQTQGEPPARLVVVEIVAEDPSGVVAAVPYRLEAEGFAHEGIATRSADRSTYQDRVVLPVGARGTPRLRSVTLRDYLGNHQEVDLDR